MKRLVLDRNINMSKPFLSIIIPSYNETKNIKDGALDKVKNYLDEKDYSWEVLIVDDNSTDKSVQLAQNFSNKNRGFRVFEEPHRGKGGTVMAGVKKAKGEVVVFIDMDQATPISELEKVVPEIKAGNDVVIGSRTGRRGAPLSRKVMAYGFVVLRSIILGLPYKDTQCGFKAFNRVAAKNIFDKMIVFASLKPNPSASVTAGFDLETLFVARKLNLKIKEVPVAWDYKDTERVSAVKDSIEAIVDMLKIRMYSLFGKYNFET